MQWRLVPEIRDCDDRPPAYVARVEIELINTGSELLLGRILNTHQQWICRKLSDLGYSVSRQVTVNDDASAIEVAVRDALGRSDLVLTTGGLGPTCDDITRDRVAALLGRRLIEREEVLEQIRGYFARFGKPMPNRTKVEALVPEGAIILRNQHGTAPGLAIEVEANKFRRSQTPSWLIMLPGPPRELKPMFLDAVLPLLARVFPLESPFHSRTWRTTGIGESLLEEKLTTPLLPWTQAGMDLGFCARVGEVEVRLSASGTDAPARLEEASRTIRAELGDDVFGEADETFEEVVVRSLGQHRKTVALAESCTGGHIANRITNIPGASAVFLGGFVTYANDVKSRVLGVSESDIAKHGAVSEPVAREMAEGARKLAGADYALGVTGIAGPGGGTPEKPVGTVFIALAGPEGTEVRQFLNALDRETFKFLTAQQALKMLFKRLNALGDR